MHPHQAALLESAQTLVSSLGRFHMTRDFYLPAEVRGTEPINPEGTDLYVWKYEYTGPKGVRPCAVAFVGKQNKPIWNTSFRSEQDRERAIEQTADGRRKTLEEKAKQQKARKDFQHSLEVGDILYASWGYEQTNVDFYQVIEVRGKEVVVREISSKITGNRGGPSESVVADPDNFIGPPLRKRPQGQGTHVYVKIDDVRTAHEWDGRPLHQTGPNYGH